MKNWTMRIVALAAVVLLALTLVPAHTLAQVSGPGTLAYVGNDFNVYLIPPGGGQGTPLTTNADFKLPGTAPATHNYGHLGWSPNGSALAFQDLVKGDLYVARMGQPLQLLASNISTDYPPTWLGDSSAVAYVINTQQTSGNNIFTMGIQQISPNGGPSTAVGTFTEDRMCGGGSSDNASLLYWQETGYQGNSMTFAWTPNGWLYSPTCTGIGLALNNFSSQQQWKIDSVGRIAVAPNGTQAAGVLFDQSTKPSSLMTIDLTSGRNAALGTPTGLDQVGWSADQTTVLYTTLDGQNASLWKIPVQGGQGTLLFNDQGQYIGLPTTSSDSQLVVFSLISAGDNPQIQILSVAINTQTANRSTASVIAQGGRPAYSPGTTLAAAPTAAVAGGCQPRADWTFTYTIAPGDNLSSIAQRTGTTVDALVAGNCLSNPNVISAGQTLHVPNVVGQAQIPGGRRIVFQANAISAAVQGQVAANGTDRWVLKALAGQTMTAQLTFSAGTAFLVVFGADGNVLLSPNAGVSSFTGFLPSTQDYFIDVRGTAGGPATYTLIVTVPPLSAPVQIARRIVFQPNAISAAVQGQLATSGTDRWVLKALAGQTMTAQLTFSSGSAILIVFGADGNVLQSDHAGSSSFSGVLPSTQDYFIDVRASPNGPVGYTLIITVPPR